MHVFKAADATLISSERLHAFLNEVAQRPSHFDLFQTLRRVEALSPHQPRLGDALRPKHEPLRFAQNPELTFAIGAIETVRVDALTPQLLQRVFGLLGPNGALPIHLIEYARERQLHDCDVIFLAFFNHLQHRFGLFFYRAWARAQPVVSLDRPDELLLIRHLSALLGLPAPAFSDDTLGLYPKLHFVGRLVEVDLRSPDAHGINFEPPKHPQNPIHQRNQREPHRKQHHACKTVQKTLSCGIAPVMGDEGQHHHTHHIG
jgi:Type VI secretion, TssG